MRACCARARTSTMARRRNSGRARRTMPDAETPAPLFACVYEPPSPHATEPAALDRRDAAGLCAIAQDFSPRFEVDRDDLVSIDVSGLARLLGAPQTIGEELRRAAAE